MVQIKSLSILALALPLAFGAAISPREGLSLSPATGGADPLAVVKVGTGHGQLTNGQRLARGLGLMPPTKRSTANKAKRSGSPQVAATQDNGQDIFAGPVAIKLRRGRDGDAVDVGVITLPNDDSGLANFDPNAGRAQKFSRHSGSGPGSFAMAPTGIFNGVTPLLAVVIGNGAPVLSPGSSNYVPLGLGQPGNTGLINIDLPTNLLGGNGNGGGSRNGNVNGQSAMWSLGPGNELLAHYVNPDGSSSPVFLVTGGPCQHLVCLSADLNAFQQAFGNDAYGLHAFATVL